MSSANELRFDGRVAIVTGSGRGIGREYALSLAERGASVVVNDVGCELDGTGSSDIFAKSVADEIVARGGTAVANGASVASRDGAASIVSDAIANFGRLDVVVNNAGILHPVIPFAKTPTEWFQEELGVHLLGPVNVLQAARHHMVQARYGRIVNVCSGAMFGWAQNAAYAAAKAAVYSLTRSLAAEGAEAGISVNAVAPGAWTRMTGELNTDEDEAWSPEIEAFMNFEAEYAQPAKVAPAVVYMAHESCDFTGQVLTSTAGLVAKWVLGEVSGYTNHDITAEAVRDNIGQVFKQTQLHEHGDLMDVLDHVMKSAPNAGSS
ncbi:SDR family NAD(P)-dependent oxidoreductase [Rhodococcus sp. NPDC057529]|uniref:SDR family NAD(P)-dependent oxidoreductase n=1 Tax=Rhodococcus sp. NPDC057529 TaxID=3346158 RepID=UPI00366CDB85